MSEDPNRLNYVIFEKIPLENDSNYKYNEEWVKNRIEENPELLGLGDLVVIEREKKQKYGRLDFLMKDPENNMLYEVEVQLGKTDPSHILRSIEYWQSEKRRNPNYDHIAVLIAEEITERFFNLIHLFSERIPIIAIQYNLLKIDNNISLNFIKTLDVYEPLEDEIDESGKEAGKEVDIEYWKKTASPESFQITEKLIAFFKSNYQNLKINYRGGQILVRTSLNCVWWYPRKRNPTVVLGVRIPIESVEIHTKTLGDIGILPRIDPKIRIAYIEMTIKLNHIENNFDVLSSIFKEAIDFSLK